MTTLRLLGAHLKVLSADPTLTADIGRLWAPFVVPDSAADPERGAAVVLESAATGARMWVDGELAVVAAGADARALMLDFATLANRLALDACPDFAVHAAVLSTGEEVLAMPASSGVGKSTLTAACLRRGLSYVSDEALCLSYDDDLVTPYPRPLGLSPWSARAVGHHVEVPEAAELLLAAGELGARIESRRLPLTHLVLPRRDRDAAAAPPVLTAIHRADAAESLLRLSFNHFRRPHDAFALVGRLLPGVQTWVLHYADARSAADLLVARFAPAPLVDEVADL
jgi:hypothetical protein